MKRKYAWKIAKYTMLLTEIASAFKIVKKPVRL